MIPLAHIAIGAMVCAAAFSGSYQNAGVARQQSDLELLRFLSWANTYASFQYECRGYPAAEARRLADNALGTGYLSRLGSVARALAPRYGTDAVEQAQIHVTPSYPLNPATCTRFRRIIPDALAHLTELERRVGRVPS